MEHTSQPDYVLPQPSKCIECDSPAVVKGFPNALCESCREGFIKYPIPRWIKLFAVGIAAVFLLSVYKLPKNFMTGMHLQKGKAAVEERRFFTAQKELELALKTVPDNLEIQSYLLIAAFHNQDMQTVQAMADKIGDTNYTDMDLYQLVENSMKEAQYYFPDDAFTELFGRHDNDVSKIPEDSIKLLVSQHPEDIFSSQYYVRLLSDRDEYVKADSLLTGILRFDMNYYPALEMMSSVKRQENKLEESISYCDQILKLNKESSFALASKSRTLLRQKHDDEALKLALESVKHGEKDYYADGSLLLAYHFTNKKKEEEELLKKIETVYKDSAYLHAFDFVNDVISGKEPFRN